MKKEICVFLSEILSAKTLAPVIAALSRSSNVNIKVVNDGFCVEFIRTLNIPFTQITGDFRSGIEEFIRNSDAILMGKTYEEPSEYIIFDCAARLGKPVLLVVPDLGAQVVRAKLKGIDFASISTLFLADPETKAAVVQSGIPVDKIVEAGNPYFDELYEALLSEAFDCSAGIGYFSTPFELDFQRGILPADYRQADLIADIKRACHEIGVPLIGKRHPQVDAALFEGMDVFEGTPLGLLRKIKASVGSYSTTLLESYVAGVPTISYQPWDTNIREDVFRDRITIVKTFQELCTSLDQAVKTPRHADFKIRTITYNSGRSIEYFTETIQGMLLDRDARVLPRDARSSRER